jgi:TldD protein
MKKIVSVCQLILLVCLSLPALAESTAVPAAAVPAAAVPAAVPAAAVPAAAVPAAAVPAAAVPAAAVLGAAAPVCPIAAVPSVTVPGSAAAGEAPDAVSEALTDELKRSTSILHLDPYPTPYFVSYTIKEIDERICSSCLGSKAEMEQFRDRLATPIVRIGNYNLDSSGTSGNPAHSAAITVDDDYAATRRATWLTTDLVYKRAITNLEWKKAYLIANNVQDRLPDMSEEKPVNSINAVRHPTIDENKWCKTIEQLSTIFKDYPLLEKSKVSFMTRCVNRWYVNSEGTKIRDSRSIFAVKIWATAQAPDGMPLTDYEVAAAPEENQLPSYDQLKELTESLAKRVTELRLAPKGEEYCGPVLFEGQGAAEFFSQLMAPNFGLAEDYIGSERWRNPLKNALGRRILPKGVSVFDDPRAKEYKGTPLIGTYDFDDDGVPGEKVSLVENGVLRSFCQSRMPTRHRNKSNGHSLGGHGVCSILTLSSEKPASPVELKSQLTELAKDAGLDYVLVIKRIADNYLMSEYPSARSGLERRPYATPSYSRQPSDPVLAYRLYLGDGHRELVRGLEFRYVSLRTFKDIQAVGADSAAYLVEPNDYVPRHMITPSFIIGELELSPVKPEYSKPPALQSPLAGATAK